MNDAKSGEILEDIAEAVSDLETGAAEAVDAVGEAIVDFSEWLSE